MYNVIAILDIGPKSQEGILPETTTIGPMLVTDGNKNLKSTFINCVFLMPKLCFVYLIYMCLCVDLLNVNVITIVNNQNNIQEHELSFPLDLNQTITIIDTMQGGDGKKIIYSTL